MSESKRFTVEDLMELSKQIKEQKGYVNLHTFNDEMTISQVVRFFEKQGRSFTKTMIQNYVRVGVLPPPVDKRYYTKNHLVLLTLIDTLKEIYSLEEIKQVFAPILRDSDTFEDDVINVSDVYQDYIELHDGALKNWEMYLPDTLDQVKKLMQRDNIAEEDESVVSAFMLVLTLMAQSIAMKQLIELITKKYLKD